MADIELVIKIPQDFYKFIKDHGTIAYGQRTLLFETISNGKPLPKGHGKIGDIDKLHDIFKKACDAYDIDNLSFISEVNMNFDLAPTIIEANKVGEDKE